MKRTISFIKFPTLSLVMAFLLLSQSLDLFAQPPGFPPPYTPPMNFNYNYYQAPVNREYDMTVYMRDGRVIKKSLVLFIKNISEYEQFVKYGEENISPPATDSIIASGFVGLPVGKTWVWRNVPGKINLYSFEPGFGVDNENMINKGSEYKYFDKSDKSLLLTPYSINALQNAVADNAKSLGLIKAYRKGIMINCLMLVGGGALALGAFLVAQSRSDNIPRIMLFSGGAIVIGSSIPYFIARNKDKHAIENYNSNEQIK